MEGKVNMPEYRVKREGLAYSVVGHLRHAKEGDVLPEGTWDAFTTNKHIAFGYIEEVTNLETAEPAIEVVEEAEKALEDMTVAELKALCKERGLAASGKKADLLARLHGEEE